MKCAVGSRFFGASVFDALRKEDGVEFTSIVAPAPDDRLALAAQAAVSPCMCSRIPRSAGRAIVEGTDLIVAAHTMHG
jgi:hypothetical protein